MLDFLNILMVIMAITYITLEQEHIKRTISIRKIRRKHGKNS